MTCQFQTDAATQAALTVCEALILTLGKRGVLERDELLAALGDAREAHVSLARAGHNRAVHARSAEIVQTLIDEIGSSLGTAS